MRYIQRKGQGYFETVDESPSFRGAKVLLDEYRLSDPSAEYYISQRACKGWNDE